jgi:cobyrinic acid a,c-diamide synthase
MTGAVRDFARSGRPIYAECGGLMYLAEGIRTLDGHLWPMVGVVAGEAVMSERLQALGYAEVETREGSILGPAGMLLRGHQFRYSTLTPAPSNIDCVYSVRPRWGGAPFNEGYRIGNVLASYVHLHWASNPRAAEALVNSCAVRRESRVLS